MANTQVNFSIVAIDKFSNVMKSVSSKLSANQKAARISSASVSKHAVSAAKTQTSSMLKMAGATVTSVKDVFRKGRTEVQKTQETIRKFENRALKMGLGLLFAGMALQKFAKGAIRSIFNTYTKVAGENSKLANMTGELQAKFALFKFSIVDALTQSPLFQKMIDGAGWLLDKLNALGPKTKASIGIALGALVVLGTVMLIAGQTITFMSSQAALMVTSYTKVKTFFNKAWPLISKWGVSAFDTIKGASKKAAKAMSNTFSKNGQASVGSLFKMAAVVLIIASAVILLRKVFTSEMNITQKVIWAVLIGLTAIGLVLAVLGVTAALPFVAIALGIAAVIGLALAFKEELGIAVGAVIGLFLQLAKLISDHVLSRIESLGKAVVWIGTKLGFLEDGTTFDIGVTTKGIDDAIKTNKAKISTLNERRKNRGSFGERTGINALKDSFGKKPELATTPSSSPNSIAGMKAPSANQITNNTQTNNITIDNSGSIEDDVAAEEKMARALEEKWNKQIGSTGGG